MSNNIVDPVSTAANYDAQQVVEEIHEGDREAPAADVEADYEASKQFSTSPIDQTEAGVEATATATASKFALPQPDQSVSEFDATGNPDDYRQMAQSVNSVPEGSAGASTDDLYQKALEKGKAGV